MVGPTLASDVMLNITSYYKIVREYIYLKSLIWVTVYCQSIIDKIIVTKHILIYHKTQTNITWS